MAGAFSLGWVSDLTISRFPSIGVLEAVENFGMSKRSNRFSLIISPRTIHRTTLRFSLTERDLDDALSDGMASAEDPFDRQLSDTAYYMVITRRVCKDSRLVSQPWVVVRNGFIIGRNARAVHISNGDIGW